MRGSRRAYARGGAGGALHISVLYALLALQICLAKRRNVYHSTLLIARTVGIAGGQTSGVAGRASAVQRVAGTLLQ